MGRVFKLIVVLAAVLVLLAVAAYWLLPFFRSGARQGAPVPPGPLYEEEEAREVYPVLDTLSYTLVGTREYASWIWSMLGEFDQGDPRIAPYLEWLGWALANIRVRPHVYGDYIAVDTPIEQWVARQRDGLVIAEYVAKPAMLPADGSKVRMGFVRIPFGYGIIVTAYQDSEGQVVIVIHGTVVDETEFYELAVRALAYPVIGIPPPPQGLQACAEPAMDECTENPWLTIRRRFNFTVYWFLWRTMLPGKGYLEVNETLRIPVREVYLLIEMPVLGATPPPPGQELVAGSLVFGCLEMSDDLRAMVFEKFGTRCLDATMKFEPVYLALSHPVFGLASNFAEVGEREALRLASYMVAYREPYYGFRTVLTARLIGGAICEGASTSTAMSASLFGYPAIVSENRSLLHEVSGYLRLSSMDEQGVIQLNVDLDGDGVPDSYDVLVDTAMLPLTVLAKSFTTVRMYCFLLVCVGMPGFEDEHDYIATYAGVSMSLIGVPQVVLRAPDWLKTPALVRYQWLTERLVNESLMNVAPIAEMKLFGTEWIYGYVYDEERDAFVPVRNRTYVYSIPSDRFPLLIEPAIRVIFAEKGIGPGLFTPPSAQYVKPVVGNLPILYQDTEVLSTRHYLFEGFRRLAEERARQAEGYNQVNQTQEVYVPILHFEFNLMLEPLYAEVYEVINGEWVVARAFEGWAISFADDTYSYEAWIYRVSGNTFRLWVGTADGTPIRVLDFEGMPPNGTRIEFELGRRRITATVYYRWVEHELGVVEVSRSALTLLREYEHTLPGGEVVTARLYVINATTVNGEPALLEWRRDAIVVVYGTVGTLEASATVVVYGASAITHYTATAELILPNGTAIPLDTTWRTPNPPPSRVVAVSASTHSLSPTRLSGATLRITIRELGLTVVIRIPE